jgi:diguanylate cyclase
MSKHKVPVTPANYAVWYHYVSGANDALRHVIDELIEDGAEVTEAMTRKLYHEYVSECNEERLQQARTALDGLVGSVDGTLETAQGEVTRYGESLARYAANLGEQPGDDTVRAIVQGLIRDTASVQEVGDQLHSRLDSSRQEVEALREELQLARQEALTDALTGLTNRKGFDQTLAEMMNNGSDNSTPLCLILVDIDFFKRVNDTYGHLLGDNVIRHVAKILHDTVKGKDCPARYGGEEFAVLLPDTNLAGAMTVAEQIRTTVAGGRLVKADTREVIDSITVSAGVACWQGAETADELIGRADRALYRSKEEGRNRVTGADDG